MSAPVVSRDGKLLGRITIDDVVDVIREEADHSVMSMAGLDRRRGHVRRRAAPRARRRAVWLSINLATAFFAANVVGLFEATIEKVVALAVLMPIVASMGGIAGSQTLVLIIRGLALGQVEQANARWLLVREILVGLLNGVLLAGLVGVAAGLWFHKWTIGLIIFAALMINLFAAALAGVGVPLILQAHGHRSGAGRRRRADDGHRYGRLRFATGPRHAVPDVGESRRIICVAPVRSTVKPPRNASRSSERFIAS